jgi:hypothetical protein
MSTVERGWRGPSHECRARLVDCYSVAYLAQTMIEEIRSRVAILHHRDRAAGENAPPEGGRFGKVFQAMAGLGMVAEPALYHDEACDEIRQQLMRVDGVLVWVNPVEGGRDRSVLDSPL